MIVKLNFRALLELQRHVRHWTRGEETGHSNIYDGELKMPDQEKRVEKVNIGADFTLRYCEYLPWLDLERGRVRYHPLCHSCGRIAAASDPGTRGTVSRPGARLTGNNFNNMSPIVTSVTHTLATMEST